MVAHEVEKLANGGWSIKPDASKGPNIFVPDRVKIDVSSDENEEDNGIDDGDAVDISWQTLGQFCNDLALPASDHEAYTQNAARNSLNVISLVPFSAV